MSELYPWLQTPWDRLWLRHCDSGLPHGLLLLAPIGCGKGAFAEHLVKALLCSNRTSAGFPCDLCRSCQLFEAGNHPDHHLVQPEQVGKAIKIDQIRKLCWDLGLTAQFSGYKVAVITATESMTEAAFNSLLKTLEEPSNNTLLLLLCSQPARLPKTIISRCETFSLPLPDSHKTLSWLIGEVGERTQEELLLALSLSFGAPLLAKKALQDEHLDERRARLPRYQALFAGRENPVQLAALWKEVSQAKQVVFELRSWVSDLIRLRLFSAAKIENLDCKRELLVLAESLDLKSLYRYSDRLQSVFREGESSMNPQTVLEELLIVATELVRRR
ncbi:MAG: DNA polymerase III subunit delta' C-terminal domain-containing protein [Gammaproteobacteria bacterium]|nr:DNA polymerase III subunit delta' C-terminal domain-containing protein [Gammaproteobacteria bacterium]